MSKRNLFQRILNFLGRYRNLITVIGLVLVVAFIIYGWNRGIFTSEKEMEIFLEGFGGFAPLVFVLVQIVQVIIPIIPGAVGCLFGVIFFGALQGFIYNYIGICIGSIIVFALARSYGKNFVIRMTGEKFYNKYVKYLDSKRGFNKAFAILIFLPVAPDDFLCYLAGLSNITFKKYLTIILLGKPASIFLYSLGLDFIFSLLIK